MKKATVQAAQAVLILIARIGWGMYQSVTKNFTSFNAKYTEQYGKDALDAVNAAAALPSSDEIGGSVTIFLNKLKSAGLNSTNLCQFLFKYIEDTFAPADWAAAKREAGSALYKKAARGNWASISKLLEAATAFIVKYSEQLSLDGKGMPLTFPGQLAESKTDYDAALENYSLARQNAKLQTAARIEAYKAVHVILLAMLKDAQRIFRFDAANKKAFTFAAIKRTVAPEVSGVHISIKETITALPVTTARILFQPGNITADTSKKGVSITKLKAGTYSATITIPGFDTILLNSIQVTAGKMHRIRLQAQKAEAVA